MPKTEKLQASSQKHINITQDNSLRPFKRLQIVLTAPPAALPPASIQSVADSPAIVLLTAAMLPAATLQRHLPLSRHRPPHYRPPRRCLLRCLLPRRCLMFPVPAIVVPLPLRCPSPLRGCTLRILPFCALPFTAMTPPNIMPSTAIGSGHQTVRR